MLFKKAWPKFYLFAELRDGTIMFINLQKVPNDSDQDLYFNSSKINCIGGGAGRERRIYHFAYQFACSEIRLFFSESVPHSFFWCVNSRKNCADGVMLSIWKTDRSLFFLLAHMKYRRKQTLRYKMLPTGQLQKCKIGSGNQMSLSEPTSELYMRVNCFDEPLFLIKNGSGGLEVRAASR